MTGQPVAATSTPPAGGWPVRLLLVCLLAGIGVYLLRPLYDPDVYWHLKTGEWIWQHRMLPTTDAFGVSPVPPPSPRNDFIFSSYWLIQLIMHGCFTLGGMGGIITLRWLLAGAAIYGLHRWSRLSNAGTLVAAGTGVLLLLEFYFLERPQFLSFIGFGLVLGLLLHYRETPAEQAPPGRLALILAGVMVLWANLHGGFFIGQALLVYVAVMEGLKQLHPTLAPLPRCRYWGLLLAVAAAVAASFLNPNAVNLIRYLPVIFDGDYYHNAQSIEMHSLLYYFSETRDRTIFFYLAAMAATGAVLFRSPQRTDLTWLGLLGVTMFMGYQHLRLTPYFIVVALLFLTRRLAGIGGRQLLVAGAILALTAWHGLQDEMPRLRSAFTSGWIPAEQYPVDAAAFIADNRIGTNLYAPMEWGGYLLWRLGPERKVFYDGRTLSVQRAMDYQASRVISPLRRRQAWQGLFDAYAIDLLVLPRFEPNGTQNTLTESVANDQNWLAVYADAQNLVFMRNSGVATTDR